MITEINKDNENIVNPRDRAQERPAKKSQKKKIVNAQPSQAPLAVSINFPYTTLVFRLNRLPEPLLAGDNLSEGSQRVALVGIFFLPACEWVGGGGRNAANGGPRRWRARKLCLSGTRLAHLATVETAVHGLVADTATQRCAQAGLQTAIAAALSLRRRSLLVLHAALGRIVTALWLRRSVCLGGGGGRVSNWTPKMRPEEG